MALSLQAAVGWLLSPAWTTATWATIRAAGCRFRGLEETRRLYRRLRAAPGPVLVCATHLTLVDSFLLGFALGHPAWFVRHFGSLPWNVPEATIFQRTRLLQGATWLMKCVPIVRGGGRA